MSKKSEASRLADELDAAQPEDLLETELVPSAATELRRLHEENEDWKKGYGLLFKEYMERKQANAELLQALLYAKPHIAVGYSAAQRYEIDQIVESAISKHLPDHTLEQSYKLLYEQSIKSLDGN